MKREKIISLLKAHGYKEIISKNFSLCDKPENSTTWRLDFDSSNLSLKRYVLVKDGNSYKMFIFPIKYFNCQNTIKATGSTRWIKIKKSKCDFFLSISKQQINQQDILTFAEEIYISNNILKFNAQSHMISTVVWNRSQKTRKIVIDSAHSRCAVCDRTVNADQANIRASSEIPELQCHHVIPLATQGRDKPENCIAVCPDCHRSIHLGKDIRNICPDSTPLIGKERDFE